MTHLSPAPHALHELNVDVGIFTAMRIYRLESVGPLQLGPRLLKQLQLVGCFSAVLRAKLEKAGPSSLFFVA